ncbi:MAG: HAD family hydrolase [Mariniphaga sp.]|nr:HAD family hydrolase [Mariniphaga sp.]
MEKNKALFLDRDGVINIETNYVFKISDFIFIPEIFKIIKKYQDKGFLIFVITNQAGIARNYYTEKDVIKLNNWMVEKFREKGIIINEVYFCPHHPDFTGECECRKPKPGMILEAIKKYNIDPAKSVLIGDKESDIMAGINAKIGKNIYIHDLLN